MASRASHPARRSFSGLALDERDTISTKPVHVSENDRGVPGTGQVDWDSYFGGFKSTGYDGYFTIEAFGRALPGLVAATKVWRDLFPDALGLCRDGIAFIKSKT